MAITASMVKELREMTGAGMMDCKKALAATDGDMDKAVEFLREKGLAGATKKAGRIAAEGIVMTKVTSDEKKAVVVEVNAETDFVAKNEKFQNYVSDVAEQALNTSAADIDAFLAEKWAKDPSLTVAEALSSQISIIGENMNIRRFTKMTGTLVPYMHDGGRLGTLVKLDTDKPEDATVLACGKNVALQITALNAQYVSQADIPADVLANEKEVQLGLVRTENEQSAKPKPENVLEKIVEGRLRKYFEEVCLLDQKYFKDDTMSIAKYVESEAKAAGASIKIDSFVRYERGEGIEKKADDFASEVASMVK